LIFSSPKAYGEVFSKVQTKAEFKNNQHFKQDEH